MRAYVGGTATEAQGGQTTGITIVGLSGPDVTPVATAAGEAVNPMYLALSPDGRVLYAAHATPDAQVSAWRVDGDRLTPLGEPRSAGGSTACHLSLHPGGRHLLTANYGSGTVAVHPIADDGALGEATHVVQHDGAGPDTERQDGPHTHMVVTDPDDGPGRGHVLAVDLGNDTVYRYRLDVGTGRLTEVDRVMLPPGTGPRHLVVAGRYAYVAGELAATLSVIDLASSPPAVLATVPTHVTGGSEPSYPSAIRLGADGGFCYVANRGPNTLAVFAVDGPDVRLTTTVDAGGDYPWDVVVLGDHLYAVNQRSSTLTAFALDPATGVPSPAGTPLENPYPVCLLPVPGQSG